MCFGRGLDCHSGQNVRVDIETQTFHLKLGLRAHTPGNKVKNPLKRSVRMLRGLPARLVFAKSSVLSFVKSDTSAAIVPPNSLWLSESTSRFARGASSSSVSKSGDPEQHSIFLSVARLNRSDSRERFTVEATCDHLEFF